MNAKSYVVRGKDESGPVHMIGAGVFATAASGEPPEVFIDLDVASAARRTLAQCCTDVRIFAVAEDGTETPLPTYEEALAALAEVDDILTEAGHPAAGPADTLGARVGRAVEDRDVPGEDGAKISQAASREWWRASNTTKGTEEQRFAAARAAQETARAGGLAAYRAERRARKEAGAR